MIDWRMEVELIASHFPLYYFRQIGKSLWRCGMLLGQLARSCELEMEGDIWSFSIDLSPRRAEWLCDLVLCTERILAKSR